MVKGRWINVSRLIDADKLIKAMYDRYDEKVKKVPDNLAEGFMQVDKLIKEQPTVYNVDDTITSLEKMQDTYSFLYDKRLEDYDRGFADGIEYALMELRGEM